MVNPLPYYNIIRKPMVTEKSTVLRDIRNHFTFKVHPKANKPEIKKAIETLFEVHVEKVRILNMPGKLKRFMGRPGRSAPWKKAVVTLRDGEQIDIV